MRTLVRGLQPCLYVAAAGQFFSRAKVWRYSIPKILGRVRLPRLFLHLEIGSLVVTVGFLALLPTLRVPRFLMFLVLPSSPKETRKVRLTRLCRRPGGHQSHTLPGMRDFHSPFLSLVRLRNAQRLELSRYVKIKCSGILPRRDH